MLRIIFPVSSLVLGCPENSYRFWRKIETHWRRFKFLISFIKFKSFAARTFRTTQYKWRDRKNNPQLSFCLMNVWASSELLLFFIWCLQRYCDMEMYCIVFLLYVYIPGTWTERFFSRFSSGLIKYQINVPVLVSVVFY